MILQSVFGLFERLGHAADREGNDAVITAEKVRGFLIGEESDSGSDFPKHLYRDVPAKALVDLHGISIYWDDKMSMRVFGEFSENTAMFSNNQTDHYRLRRAVSGLFLDWRQSGRPQKTALEPHSTFSNRGKPEKCDTSCAHGGELSRLRHPNINGLRNIEHRWHDSNHGESLTIQTQGRAYDSWVPAVLLLPETLTNHHNLLPA